MRIHLTAYLVVTVLLVGVWLLVGLVGGGWFPWPVWPVVGWGTGVAVHAIPVHRALQQRPGCRLTPAPTPFGR